MDIKNEDNDKILFDEKKTLSKNLQRTIKDEFQTLYTALSFYDKQQFYCYHCIKMDTDKRIPVIICHLLHGR